MPGNNKPALVKREAAEIEFVLHRYESPKTA